MDGVTGVTQCPIAPNNSFQYSFSTGGQVGTYWYHSHFGMFLALGCWTAPNAILDVQYCDGIRGALIIYDPNDPLKKMYDGEWYVKRELINDTNDSLIVDDGKPILCEFC